MSEDYRITESVNGGDVEADLLAASWMARLEKGLAQVAAGQIVAIEPVLERLRAKVAKAEAQRVEDLEP
jgi:predicted transcriptional regulator